MTPEDKKAVATNAVKKGWDDHLEYDHVGGGKMVPCNDDCYEEIKERIIKEVVRLL